MEAAEIDLDQLTAFVESWDDRRGDAAFEQYVPRVVKVLAEHPEGATFWQILHELESNAVGRSVLFLILGWMIEHGGIRVDDATDDAPELHYLPPDPNHEWRGMDPVHQVLANIRASIEASA